MTQPGVGDEGHGQRPTHDIGRQPERGEPDALSRTLDVAAYGLSLPERLARAMVGTTSRALRGTAELAVPDAFKGGQLYEITVRKMLGFLADDVGRLTVAGPAQDREESEDGQVAKIAVGNAIDFAGMAVLHVSPMWVLAIFSDVALGTKSYLGALVTELKTQGVLSDSETIEGVDELLDALQKTSGTLASSIDSPPISVEQLRASVTQLREQASKANLAKLVSASDLERVWGEIEEATKLEGRSVFEVSSAVAMMTYTNVVRAGKGAVGTVTVALDLIGDNVVDHYLGALARIREKGYYECVMETYEEFVEDLRHMFDTSAQSTTEKIIRGGWLRRLWRKITGSE